MKKQTLIPGLLAAAALSMGGLALAQSNAVPPSSTAGAGCTATANAMRGGNLGGSPSSTACAQGNTNTAAAPAAAGTTTQSSRTMGAAPDTTARSDTSAGSTSASDTSTRRHAARHVARADRN